MSRWLISTRSRVVSVNEVRAWKDSPGARLKIRYLAVEWRCSLLLIRT